MVVIARALAITRMSVEEISAQRSCNIWKRYAHRTPVSGGCQESRDEGSDPSSPRPKISTTASARTGFDAKSLPWK